MIKISPENLNECLEFNQVVFVFVKADWCKSCNGFIPMFEELEGMYRNYIRFVILDYDENRDLLMKMDIKLTPSVLIFQKAKLFTVLQGTQTKEKYERVLSTSLVA